jgi:hypothetical protein
METCPQIPETCPQIPETCPQIPETCPQIPETCPQIPETCPQIPGAQTAHKLCEFNQQRHNVDSCHYGVHSTTPQC